MKIKTLLAQSQTEGSVRLRRGINSQSGYVEIFHDAEWGRVCDTDWDHADAHVVCKQQGYNGAKFPASNFTEPPNPGLPIILDNLQCTGRETALADCPKGEWGQVTTGCQTAKVECMSYVPQFIGCFSDDLDRLLPDYSGHCEQGLQDPRCGGCDFTNKSCDSASMTVELCIEICCNDNGFIYAGLQGGDECYCGSATAQYAKIGRLPEVLCNTQCSGNPEQSCGADYKMDVYDCSSGCEAPNVNKVNLRTSPAVVQTTLYKTGQALTFFCEPGFQLQGATTISCQPGGPWSAPVPDCVEPTLTETPPASSPCSYPTTLPQNGIYTPAAVSFQPGSAVQLSCDPGYQITGNPTRTCRSNGTWTTEDHACSVVDCGLLQQFPNAIPSTSATTYETSVTFTCESGFELTAGSTGKTCDASGNWIGPDPQCAGGSTCALPPLPTRGLTTPFRDSYQPGDDIFFSCYTGYRIVGATSATCQNDGTWSDSVPTCEIVDCGALPQYPFATPITTATVFATSVTFRCDDTYEFANGATPFKTCDQNGRWVGIDPVCEQSVCPPLPKYYQAVQSTDVIVINTVVTFTCESGYELRDSNPAPTKTCTSGGIWAGPDPVCQRSGCAPLQSYPNAIKSTDATDIGTVVFFTCREGTVNLLAPDEPTKTCSPDKEWVGPDPNCVVDRDCGLLPAFPHTIPSTTLTNLNTEVSFQCEAGYQLVGSTAIKRCTQLGWQGANPTCQELTCGPIPTFPHAEVQNPSGSQRVSTTVTYICQEGYVHQGGDGNQPFKTCMDNLNWEGIDANCQELTCGPVPIFPHAEVQNPSGSQRMSTTVTYICQEGYVHQGGDGSQPFKTCMDNLNWEGTNPNCHAVDCGPPDEVPPGVITNGTDYTFNSSVTYTCNSSEEFIVGNATVYCLATGNWSSDVPDCDDVYTGAESDPRNIPYWVWIILLALVVCLIFLIASYIVYRVHTRPYEKYKKKNADSSAPGHDPPQVPLHGIAISDPHQVASANYGMAHDEEGDTGVASNESDLQDVSLGSESNYRYLGNPYAESVRSGSVHPASGTNDSGMYPSDPESNSVGTDVAGAGYGGENAGSSGKQAGDNHDGTKQEDVEKKEKDFVDDMLDSAKEKLDNCVVQ
ncbi:sushi, von Willebrand factor type A, EGF and pentraxin domain-containing protein 1-like isoform X2 [Acanthaster planci]|uniref:Sushi, von Willebrand factor type A, EGF and pentraxin domain-containing protein 1-like isoform X2 n=1 Tax=Acanthaster planci TaxID=133434 RepID=A0A8B7ZGD5_ACAPL|nr:sushi, von Willebrand factor type A, EGF and pentraxin domain-containing protein 1-like isoform X2 [Acanthaster planci]